ncbi:MAG: hypothetical protein IJI60_04920 [Bacilli bacterium]|nr:hypothetical protein [Bacilli bacterium]
MIEKLTYEEILNVSKDLVAQVEIIRKLMQGRKSSDIDDFAATVEGYSKFLENTVEINKDADEALKDLKVN